MHARRGHESCDTAYELALLNEYAHAKHFHLGGVSLDRRKFFDLLPHDLIFSLLETMGLPTTSLQLSAGFINSSPARSRLPMHFAWLALVVMVFFRVVPFLSKLPRRCCQSGRGSWKPVLRDIIPSPLVAFLDITTSGAMDLMCMLLPAASAWLGNVLSDSIS